MSVIKRLREIDKELSDAYRKINTYDEMSSVRYNSLSRELDSLEYRLWDIEQYANLIQSRLENDLESYWKEKLNRCLDLLSSASNLSGYQTDNTPKVSVYKPDHRVDFPNAYNVPVPSVIAKPKIGFADFLPVEEPELTDKVVRISKGSFCVEGFAALYQEEYKNMREKLGMGGLKLENYLANVMYSAYIKHKSPYTYKSFLNDVLDASVVVPLVEAVTGINMITGDKLKSSEQKGKAVAGGVGLVTFGLCAVGGYALKGMSVTQSLIYAGGSTGIAMFSSGSGSLTNELLLKNGLDEPTSHLLSAGISFGVAWKLASLYNKSWDNKLMSPEPEITTVKPTAMEEVVSGVSDDVAKGAGGAEPFELYRQKANTGEFSKLKEPMQIEHVKMVAEDAGIDLTGIKIQIENDPSLVGRNLCGYTTPDGKTIILYPDAFATKEQLIKTIGHERVHVFQTSIYGKPTSSDMLIEFENGALQSEQMWFDYYNYLKGGK